ncbi:type I-E CRISPR-associated protein Cas6/Cse3/CasE [Actinokineospora sp. NBRC 105648]|uniref:type I-E CRISPR-associated protein Cas6/Cse3/CasE n=1 Tax=Actinokineospora sp. NBRC 105648 TaxID=3032206 RepID=UPI0024A03F26|nr:type I-E CRISPR-associated protein Cas6/Cse3/CasE [Actinokineospora sp. NBRC 105648]GLZ38733.1 type I-E CRISPR-associated protein Cas6/Cse3/CasE [Actinokineospora sp. NBRC 105648]
MHLTRLELNPARRGARELLASPHRLHGAVVKAFPAAHRDPTTAGRVLWRLDSGTHQTLLYIVSPHLPDLTHVVEVAGWPTTSSWASRPYTPLLDRLAVGQQWAFRLTANPTRSSRKPDADSAAAPAEKSRRRGHVTAAQQTTWLLDRRDQHGFSITETIDKELDVAVQSRHTWRFTRDSHTVTLATATFGGRLEITDVDAFRRALTHGIGPAKGYGCGLLTLAR